MPYGECWQVDRINEWNVVNGTPVTVRNGANYFLVKTKVACPRMTLGGGLHFRTSQSDRAVGKMRICGGISEEIVRRDDPPCAIRSVSTIDNATFERLSKKSKQRRSGAGPHGAVP
jgi:hypothetical protein